MKTFTYTPQGVCTKKITIYYEVVSGEPIVSWIDFEGGCPGYSQAVANLAAGQKAALVARSLSDIKCGAKQTSCPAQLSVALDALVKEVKA